MGTSRGCCRRWPPRRSLGSPARSSPARFGPTGWPGRWPLASGSSHATWLVGGCRLLDGDQPRLTPAGRPELRLMFLPVGDAAILDTWHTAGLRGTASNDFVLRDCFIPAHRTCWFTHAPARSEPLYRLPAIAVFAAAGT